MITVVRIEHPEDGDGLFNSLNDFSLPRNLELSFIEQLNKKHRKFPRPVEDEGIERDPIRDKEFCAFFSIEQLQKWIEPDWFEEIKELGFKILMIELSEAVVGEYQVLFKKEHIIKTKDISDLF